MPLTRATNPRSDVREDETGQSSAEAAAVQAEVSPTSQPSTSSRVNNSRQYRNILTEGFYSEKSAKEIWKDVHNIYTTSSFTSNIKSASVHNQEKMLELAQQGRYIFWFSLL